jgi:hypothetical protein
MAVTLDAWGRPLSQPPLALKRRDPRFDFVDRHGQ